MAYPSTFGYQHNLIRIPIEIAGPPGVGGSGGDDLVVAEGHEIEVEMGGVALYEGAVAIDGRKVALGPCGNVGEDQKTILFGEELDRPDEKPPIKSPTIIGI